MKNNLRKIDEINEFDLMTILEDEKIVNKNNNPFNIFEDEDDLNSFKVKQKYIRQFFNKISKNKFVIIAVLLVCITYYYFLFYSILPLYEATYFTDINFVYNEDKFKQKINRIETEYFDINMRISNIDDSNNFNFFNKGIIYSFFFHFFFLLFLYSFIKISLIDPGNVADEYNDLFNVSKYYEFYLKFYNRIFLAKNKENHLMKEDDIIQENNTAFPKIKSSTLLKEKAKRLKTENFEHVYADEESFLVEKQNFGGQNSKLRKFEELIYKLRNNEKYSKFWNLECYNHKSKTLRENLCRICTMIKPERTSHCKTCRKCIKKLDHHCSIVNNCVGYNTYKLFINMLIFGLFTIFLVIITLMENLKFYLTEFSITTFTSIYILIIFTMVVIECFLLYFFIFHCSLIFKGVTQLENNFGFHIYDVEYYGKLLNKSNWEKFIEIFGNNPLYWFLPTTYKKSEEEIGGYIFE